MTVTTGTAPPDAAGRLRVGVLFGGESPEHEVSLQSARNVMAAMDASRYEVVPIAIDRAGRWRLQDGEPFRDPSDPRRIALAPGGTPVALLPGRGGRLVSLVTGETLPALDVAFPVLHGPRGEDGTVQGLLSLAHVPFVGPGVLGSAAGMDKDLAKRLLRDAGLPVTPFITVERSGRRPGWEEATTELGSPLFVKPANMGSSVGVSKARDADELARALDEAFRFDVRVLLERTVQGREIEVAVLGNEEPEASVPGEIVPRHEFYSYEAKYLDDEGAELKIPAELPDDLAQRARELAVRTARTLCCEGMARVDLFLAPGGDLLVNEINTIPGFTRISMYPKLWAASGLSYPDLIGRLLDLALARAARERELASALDLAGPRPAGEAE